MQPLGSPVVTQPLPSGNSQGSNTPEEDLDRIEWLRKQVDDKETELKEWRGLLSQYQNTVKQLIEAERKLRRLPPPATPEEATEPSVEKEGQEAAPGMAPYPLFQRAMNALLLVRSGRERNDPSRGRGFTSWDSPKITAAKISDL